MTVASPAPQPATGEVVYRRARMDDAVRTFEIVQESAGDLNRRSGRPVAAALPAERVIRLRHFVVRYEPERFWVAEVDGLMVGAAYATLRDDVWYLDALHVLPEYQSRKIGSELIRRCLAGTGPTTTLTVLTDAINPVSNGLYMRFGMLPQDSTITFDGPIEGSFDGGSALAASAGLEPADALESRPIDPSTDLPALAAHDLATVGFARPTDHDFWLGVPGLFGRILERGGSARGYVYVSEGGAIGPVAVVRPEDLPAALDVAANVAAAAGASSLHIRLFGSTRAGADWAVRRGLRVTGIGLFLTSRRVGTFEGYVTSGADALY